MATCQIMVRHNRDGTWGAEGPNGVDRGEGGAVLYRGPVREYEWRDVHDHVVRSVDMRRVDVTLDTSSPTEGDDVGLLIWLVARPSALPGDPLKTEDPCPTSSVGLRIPRGETVGVIFDPESMV